MWFVIDPYQIIEMLRKSANDYDQENTNPPFSAEPSTHWESGFQRGIAFAHRHAADLIERYILPGLERGGYGGNHQPANHNRGLAGMGCETSQPAL
jgi:hypothetical protein